MGVGLHPKLGGILGLWFRLPPQFGCLVQRNLLTTYVILQTPIKGTLRCRQRKIVQTSGLDHWLAGFRVLDCPLAYAKTFATQVKMLPILEHYTLILFGFLGSYYNALCLKSLYFFLGCTPNWGTCSSSYPVHACVNHQHDWQGKACRSLETSQYDSLLSHTYKYKSYGKTYTQTPNSNYLLRFRHLHIIIS